MVTVTPEMMKKIDEDLQGQPPANYAPLTNGERVKETSRLVDEAMRSAVESTTKELRRMVADTERRLTMAKEDVEGLIKDMEHAIGLHVANITTLMDNVKGV